MRILGRGVLWAPVWIVVLGWAAGPLHAQTLLTVNEAVQIAIENNYGLQVVRNELEIASNNHALGNAGLLPAVTVTAGRGGSISNTEQLFLNSEETVVREGALARRQNAGIALDWSLFQGMGRLAAYRRLELLETQQALVAEQSMETTTADVIILYNDIIRQQQQLEVFNEAVQISEERLRIAELRRDLGSASELEVRQALVDLNTDRAGVLRQQVAVATAKVNLNRILGRGVQTAFTVTPVIDVDSTLDRETLLVAAQAGNPALQFAETGTRVAAQFRREVRAERFPEVSGSLGYTYSFLDSESGFLSENRTFDFTYGLTATYQLFDGFSLRRREQNAAIQVQNAELSVADTRIMLEAELNALYLDYQASLQLITLERSNLEAARDNVEIALERFELGTITSVELREVQEALVAAESRLITALFEAKRDETELVRITGELVGR